VKSAKDKRHKACERASETRERTLHGQEQNNAHGRHERVSLVPRLPRSGTQTLKLCRRGEPGSFSHVRSAKR